jgi:hypothetical protein
MVPALAIVATVVSTLFAQAVLVRFTQDHRPQDRAWAISLALFALASAALTTGVVTGWDEGTFRLFYLLGAVVTVPWLALGTVYLHTDAAVARRVEWGVVFFTGLATGVVLAAPIDGPIQGEAIPVGSDVFGAFPRVLAAVGSGVGATVIILGALYSAVRFARAHEVPGNGRRAGANVLIAAGTLILSSGGLLQGIAGKDEAFVLSLAAGIVVIYSGFLVASRSSRRSTLPDRLRGSISTSSTRAGTL